MVSYDFTPGRCWVAQGIEHELAPQPGGADSQMRVTGAEPDSTSASPVTGTVSAIP